MAERKKIWIQTDGSWVDVDDYPEDGSLYRGGTRVGAAKNMDDALAIARPIAEREKGGGVRRIDIEG